MIRPSVKVGDNVTMTLSLNNVKQLESGEFNLQFSQRIIQVCECKAEQFSKRVCQGKRLTGITP